MKLERKPLMMCKMIVTIGLMLIATVVVGQEVIFGTNNYIEYQVGTLPMVISVSHGGALEPASIPNRTCNNPVFATDVNTIETALEIKNALYATTGCYPHLIICHLKRSKLDCNRNLTTGACGNEEAETAWIEFHGFIDTARDAANAQYDSQSFFVDLHGHGNPIQRIELGYLLYDDELELPDSVLNTMEFINYSSIRDLALNNASSSSHAALLRGPSAFGTLLSELDYPSVPSADIPSPGTTTNYFSGGYITANHTSYAPGIDIDGVQMELNFSGIRDSPAHRTEFGAACAQALTTFIETHYSIHWMDCSPLSTSHHAQGLTLRTYPNPAAQGAHVRIDGLPVGPYSYVLLSALGQVVDRGALDPAHRAIDTSALQPGAYVLSVQPIQAQADPHTRGPFFSAKLLIH